MKKGAMSENKTAGQETHTRNSNWQTANPAGSKQRKIAGKLESTECQTPWGNSGGESGRVGGEKGEKE